MQPNYPPFSAGPQWYGQPGPPAKQGTGRGLAIASIVLSSVALLGVLVVGVLFLAIGPGDSSDSSSDGPLTSQVTRSTQGTLAGATLADSISDRIQQDGGDVTQMRCPATARVAQGIVTVCHGVISGDDWAVVVYFEDDQGNYTLDPI